MAKYRDNIQRSIVDQEEIESKYDYVDVDEVKSMLDDIENEVNACIELFDIDTLGQCLERLKELSSDLY